MNKIIDPVYGEIIFDENETWAYEIIHTNIFQRLQNIKQLGLCYKTFPGAVQTRFSHSIGTYYLVKKLLERKDINKNLTLKQINTIKAAALLHDIGHGPHSHGFEWYLKELNYESFEHENYSEKIINDKHFSIYKILNKNNIDSQDVADLIHAKTPEGFSKWTSYIISGQIDVDRIDYLLRDQYFCLGVNNNSRNLYRIIEKIKIDKKMQVFYFDKEDITLVEDFLYTRYVMYKELYLSKDVNDWYFIIIQILSIAKKLYLNKHKFLDKYHLLKDFLFMFNNKKIQLNNYIKLTDINFDLFIFSLQYESKKIKKLYDIYTKCDHSLIKNYEALKKIIFYDFDKPIFIKNNQTHKLVAYDKIADIYKIFLK